MESFSAIDIFDTKGTEYLFVIGYLIILIAFWRLASKPVKMAPAIKRSIDVLSEKLLKLPQGIFYSKNHTWTYLEPSGVAKVGMDSLLQNVTGEVNFNRLVQAGDSLKKGELLTEIMHQDKTLTLKAPISGEVIEINPLLNENHEVLREDPYQNYWIYKIKPDNWTQDTKSYYLAEEASTWIYKELQRFKDFLAKSMARHTPEMASYALQEGGELKGDTLAELPGEIWSDFQEAFLNET